MLSDPDKYKLGKKYDQVEDGDEIFIDMDIATFRMQCCDCGLVHDLDFDIRQISYKMHIVMTVYRNNRATAQVRRWQKRAKDTKH